MLKYSTYSIYRAVSLLSIRYSYDNNRRLGERMIWRTASEVDHFLPDFFIPPAASGPLPEAFAANSFNFFCSSCCLRREWIVLRPSRRFMQWEINFTSNAYRLSPRIAVNCSPIAFARIRLSVPAMNSHETSRSPARSSLVATAETTSRLCTSVRNI